MYISGEMPCKDAVDGVSSACKKDGRNTMPALEYPGAWAYNETEAF
jgi:hypothetical protein